MTISSLGSVDPFRLPPLSRDELRAACPSAFLRFDNRWTQIATEAMAKPGSWGLEFAPRADLDPAEWVRRLEFFMSILVQVSEDKKRGRQDEAMIGWMLSELASMAASTEGWH